MLFLLIVILPLLNFLILGIFGHKLGKKSVKIITSIIIGFSLFLVLNLSLLIIKGYFFYINLGTWINLDFFFF